ncbi:hypothetical protein L6452_26180 [Arctium lappa]|uniref:Uncharacterized protein n=1 Tax=Arctium lappa TaxID=4217 RepID=A0ACB9AC20_ARCLA|nr:hypothetical protein L6452_26180 [Arctium lappa]
MRTRANEGYGTLRATKGGREDIERLRARVNTPAIGHNSEEKRLARLLLSFSFSFSLVCGATKLITLSIKACLLKPSRGEETRSRKR